MILPLLRERLIFGTGRLAGGAYASRSKALIAACQAAGIVRFDTAPSYGMGAAEELLGSAVGAGSIIHTKVGSSRPAWSSLRGWAKYLRNSVHNRATVERVNIAPLRYQEPDHAMDFSPAAIVRSLNRSRRLLRRDRLDLVLLHEAEPWQLPDDSLSLLAAEQKTGRIGQLGFAHSGPMLRENPGWLAQTVPWPEALLGRGDGCIYHSILRAASSGDAIFSAELEQTKMSLGLAEAGAAGRYLSALVWLHQRQPNAGLVFATSAASRLGQFLALLDRIAPRP